MEEDLHDRLLVVGARASDPGLASYVLLRILDEEEEGGEEEERGGEGRSRGVEE